MATYTFSKEVFLDTMKKLIKDDEYIIYTSTPCGSISSPSKKYPVKRMELGFSPDAFANPDGISDILRSRIGGLIICKKDVLSKQAQLEIENVNKKGTEKTK